MPHRGGEEDVRTPPHRLPRVDLQLRGSLKKLTPGFPLVSWDW